MKTLVISDVHGRNTWKDILKKESDYDLVVFLGDYLDSYDIDVITQVNNFKEILELEKCVRLLGNHELHYIINTRYSGYKYATKFNVEQLILDAIKDKKLQLIYQQDKFLFSHAGISPVWLNEVIKCSLEDLKELSQLNLNYLDMNIFKGYDCYGNTTSQSPVWIRPSALISALNANKDFNYVQVIGHTSVKEAHRYMNLYLLDTQSNINPEYLIINDEIGTIKKLYDEDFYKTINNLEPVFELSENDSELKRFSKGTK